MKRAPRRIVLSLALAVAGIAATAFFWFAQSDPPAPITSDRIRKLVSEDRISPELAAEFLRLEANEARLNETLWAPEILAQDCARTFEQFWDALNAATNKLNLAAEFDMAEILIGSWNEPTRLPHGIQQFESSGVGRHYSRGEWREYAQKFIHEGWELEQTEFRHNRFATDTNDHPAESLFYFSAHLKNARTTNRAVIEGGLAVKWGEKNTAGIFQVKQIDASKLVLKTRPGEPPFKLILEHQLNPASNSDRVDPMIVHDLDGDGLSEILFVARNVVFHRVNDRFEARPLCREPPAYVATAVLADFDGDSAPDLLCAKYEGLFLYAGSRGKSFNEPPRLVATLNPPLHNAMALTCGDIDADGDLDLFIAQYKEPYEGGAPPAPYYDANDAYPAFLMTNDGRGNFTDATEVAGLAGKRWRRTFSSSFVDLDQDHDLDLLVISDFAGADLYRNDGNGHFTDLTKSWVDEPRAFGMAHAINDFNGDGTLDFLMIGMTSPAAERLEHLQLWRSGVVEDRSMRARMTHGNRLYLGSPGGGFKQTELSASIARSGWAWGAAALDVENDGFPDVYVGNGLESNSSVRDYEPECWLHDKYVTGPAALLYIKAKTARTRGREYSHGGYEKNRLYLNQTGQSFLEGGYLLGVALQKDTRNVIADDLDADGRMDLLVSTVELWPEPRRKIHVFQNQVAQPGNWIGFKFRQRAGVSPIGCQITLRHSGGAAVRTLVTGDSFRSQSALTTHFGIGASERVAVAEIRWPGGRTQKLENPEINRYILLE